MRSAWLDNARGVAICLVVIGHAIQFGSHGDLDFFANPAFVVIYAFHMPLFALLSGYLAFGSFRGRGEIGVMRSRLRGVLLPFVMWTVFAGSVDLVIGGARDPGSIARGVLEKFEYPMRSVWFLWFIFLATALLTVGVRARRHLKHAALPLSAAIPFLIPIGEHLAIYQLRWLYPFIVAGFVAHEHKRRIARFNRPAVAGAAALIFGGCYVIWNRNYSVYLSTGIRLGHPPMEDLAVWVLRYTWAFAGCVVVLSVVKWLSARWRLETLRQLGVASLGIYCVQTYMVARLQTWPAPSDETVIFLAVYVPAVAISILAASFAFTRLVLERIVLLDRLFLGGRGGRGGRGSR